jgi:hypothetical protein
MSLYINDIVTSTLPKIGASGSRNVSSSWNTSSNTAYIQIGNTYFSGYYLSNVKIDISFDNNGYLDGYSMSGSADGAGYSERGLHNLSYSQRNSVEAAYDQIEAREWAEEQALVEAAEAQKALDAAEALITQEKNELRSSFDASYYLEKYPDVKTAYGNNNELALDHYVRFGKAEGRSDVNEAEVQRLIETAEAQKALEAAEALITQEKNELRNTFDASYYLEKYPDVKTAYGNNNELALDHYVRFGKAEGRSDANESELSLRDSFTGFSTNSTIIDGGSGIDTITYSALSDSVNFALEKSNSLYGSKSSGNSDNNQDQLVISQTITETIYGGKNVSTTQSETLTNIERLHFTNKGYGLDIEGNTGIAAKVIISSFGSGNLPSKMSSILTIVDNGKTIDGISNYVIQRGLIESAIGSSTNGSFVDHVYKNVVGVTPSQADHDMFTTLLDNGTHTKSSLLAFAAETTLTEDIMKANLIDLIGVAGSADGEILALQYDLGLG